MMASSESVNTNLQDKLFQYLQLWEETPLEYLSEDDDWFLIEHEWYKRFIRVLKNVKDGEIIDEYPEPIENAVLVDSENNLVANLANGSHYDCVDPSHWKLLKEWFSVDVEIKRRVVRKIGAPGCMVNVYPIRVHAKTSKDANAALDITIDRRTLVSDLIKHLKSELGIRGPVDTCIVKDGQKFRQLTPSHVTLDSNVTGDSVELFLEEAAIEVADTEMSVVREYSTSSSDSEDSPNHRGTFASRAMAKSFQGGGGYSTMNDDDDDDWTYPYGGRGQQRAAPVEEVETEIEVRARGGLRGLQNLGNTCFMNSGLQCLSNTEPLLRYMLSGKFRDEINEKNVLGTSGKLVTAFAALLRKLWGTSSSSSVNPSELKGVVGRFKQQFSGYSQEDSQELVGCLLDGMHEDLNRVLVKPPTEQFNGDGTNCEFAAREAWSRHLLRHRSVIVDHFQGQLRNHLTCPECEIVSTVFDPYMYLTLQLPEEKFTYKSFTVVFKEPSRPRLQVGVVTEKHGTLRDARKIIGKTCGIDGEQIVFGDVWQGRVHRWVKDSDKVDAFGASDDIYAYEIGGELTTENEPKFTHSTRDSYYYTPTRSRLSSGCEWAHVMVVQRRSEGVSQWQSVPRYQCLQQTVPFILSFDRFKPITCEQVRQEVAKSVSELYSGAPLDEEKLPFDISIIESVSDRGKDLGSGDREITFDSNDICLAVDWNDLLVAREIFEHARPEEVHSSVRGKKTGDDTESAGGIRLEQCLEGFVEGEILSEQNMWRCPRCKKEVQARQKLELWSLPEILVIHLKRFSSEGYWREKLESLVVFPLENLDMSPYLARKGGPPVLYDLYAVSNHFGSASFGHYTAYAKPPMTDGWFEFNDSYVQSIDKSSVVSASGYLLFYRRKSEPTHHSLSFPNDPDPSPSAAAAAVEAPSI